MTMTHIRKTYKVPAKRGSRIKYTGGKKPLFGTILNSKHERIMVKMDTINIIYKLHPTWEIEYLPQKDTENFKKEEQNQWKQLSHNTKRRLLQKCRFIHVINLTREKSNA